MLKEILSWISQDKEFSKCHKLLVFKNILVNARAFGYFCYALEESQLVLLFQEMIMKISHSPGKSGECRAATSEATSLF